jgi:hypothetical protein
MTIYTTAMSGAQSESPNSPSQPAPGAAIDTDLYCLHCGYNLRGLFGDPVRCPECFSEASRQELRYPLRLIRRRARRLHLIGLASLVLFLVSIVSLLCISRIAAAAVPLLVATLVAFRRVSRAAPGWFRHLQAFWAFAVLEGFVIVGVWVIAAAVLVVVKGLSGGYVPLTRIDAALAAIIAALALFTSSSLRRVYREAVAELERLAESAQLLPR